MQDQVGGRKKEKKPKNNPKRQQKINDDQSLNLSVLKLFL